MPRFVVLEHESPGERHWDFMLEQDDSLATWALASLPGAAAEIPARQLPDHRLAYLDYEGEISGGRGSVHRWDEGVYTTQRRTDDQWIVMLEGRRLLGRLVLQRQPGETSQWRFTGPEAG